MILPETPPPTLRPPKTLSSDDDRERLDRALEDLIKRINGSTISSSASTIQSRILFAKNEVRPPQLAASFI